MLEDVIMALRTKAPEAVALARAEVVGAPDSAHAHHLLGMALREAGDGTGAAASFERAIELAPDESLYHFSRALLAYAQGDMAAADRASAHALALDPNQLGAYVLRVQLALLGGDAAEALRQFSLAEKIDAQHPQLIALSAQIALAQGDVQTAIDRIRRALQARPHDPQMLCLLGMAYLRQGHPAFAEQVLRNARDLDRLAIEPRRLLVQALLAQDRLDDAAIELAQWQATHPHDTGVALVAAELKLRRGDAHGALDAYRALLGRAPEFTPAIAGVEQALNAIGDRALARVVWDEVVAAAPTFDPAWSSRITVAEDATDRQDVLDRWRRAAPDSAVAILNQARHDQLHGRMQAAEAGYDAVLAHVPTQADALFGKVVCQWRREPDTAYAHLTALIALLPRLGGKPMLQYRGDLLDAMERPDEAVVDWLDAASGMGEVPAPLPLPEAPLRALPTPTAPWDDADPVVLLWGPPGSGGERLANALIYAPSRPLLLTQQSFAPRTIRPPEDFISRALDAATMTEVAADIADEYAATLEPFLRAGNLGLFDWQAHWDARTVPALRHALPRLRLLAAMRDPRDLLLNWAAFGAPAGPNFSEPLACAQWLAAQLEHLLFARDVLGLPVLLLDMDRLHAEPANAMAEIARFAGLPSAPDSFPATQTQYGPDGPPERLPAGRWRAYAHLWPDAFAALKPSAQRLGYAVD